VAIAHAHTASRDQARLRAFQLCYEAQAGAAGAPAELDALAGRAESSGWDDVGRACLFGRAVIAHLAGDTAAAGIVGELIEASTAVSDQVLLALGLGLRSCEAFSGSDPNGAMSRDADLARAVVLLERAEGYPIERIAAHKVCGVAFSTRSLFELGDAQYGSALALGAKETPGTLDTVLAPIACNVAESQVCWAAMLRQLGDEEGVTARWRSWMTTSRLTSSYAMSPGIRLELSALGLLLDALAGHDAVGAAQRLLGARGGPPCNARCTALLELAIALSRVEGRSADASQLAETAIAALDASLQTHLYDLGLYLAAEVEARRSGAESGLRYARRQLEQRWGTRLSSLGAMQSLIQSERVAEEVERLSRHARLDDLTGIGNRRALGEYLMALKLREVSAVGLILLDVDDFKSVNDQHGHLAGDAVLIEVARALDRSTRAEDLTVRLGGDEFVVVLSGVDIETALGRAADLLTQLGHCRFDEASPGLRVALSAGVSVGSPDSLPELWARADAALYRAKGGSGRRIGYSRLAAERGEPAAATL
jgi:diguanylate cyclase (GGDEF)-like protein